MTSRELDDTGREDRAATSISEAEEAKYLAAEATSGRYESLCWNIVRLSAYAENVFEEFDLTRRQYAMLSVIAHGPTSLTTLAHRCNVRPPSATIMVRGLVARDLATRSLSSMDQRRIWIAISAKGTRLLEDVEAKVEERLKEIAGFFRTEAETRRQLASIGRWGPALDGFRVEWLGRPGGSPVRST